MPATRVAYARLMDSSLPQATLETVLFAQILRPMTEKAGPAAGYAAQVFAQALVNQLGRPHE